MKTTYLRYSVILSMAIISALATGCASVAVSDDAIENRTASALGLEKSAFTVSNRVDDGLKSSYAVKTNVGKNYSCYVTGTVSVMGRAVSDAVCNDAWKNNSGKQAKKTNENGKNATCNALLKAAGRC